MVVVKKMEVVTPLLPLTEHRLVMSNLDLLMPAFDIGVFFCYDDGGKNNEMMTGIVKKGLSQVLVSFYSLAGEVVLNHEGEPEILCNNRGVDFIQASADMELQHLDPNKVDVSVYTSFVPVKKHGVLSVQVTEMKCGRLIIGCSFDHRVADSHSITKFLVAWADTTRSQGNKMASVFSPDYCRSLLHPRRKPCHPDAAIENMYVLIEPASSDSPQAPPLFHLQNRIYKINACQIQHLQSMAGPNRTKFESFSALLWKLLAKAAKEDKKRCKLGIVVNGRDCLSKSASMENYFGNVLSVPYTDASVGELKSMPLSEIANKVHACAESAANEDHFRGLVDWVEGHRPSRVMCKIFSCVPNDTEEVAVVVSSAQHFPICKMDFGWGRPSFMSAYFPWPGTTGYVLPLPSSTNDGDWIVYMHLFEKHLDFVEKEAPHIFKPFAFSPLKEFRGTSKL